MVTADTTVHVLPVALEVDPKTPGLTLGCTIIVAPIPIVVTPGVPKVYIMMISGGTKLSQTGVECDGLSELGVICDGLSETGLGG